MKRKKQIKIEENCVASAVKTVEVITHHSKDEDPKCIGDYYQVSIHIDGVEVIRYGDHVHEQGSVKAQAWIDALRHVYGAHFEVIQRSVADTEL